MKDITVIIPIHKVNAEIFEYLDKAIESVDSNRKNYKHSLPIILICSDESVADEIKNHYVIDDLLNVIVNNTKNSDFCSQINYAVDNVTTEYFSILEFDDTYTKNWFTMANEYFYTNEDVSLFLPINVHHTNDGIHQYCNEMVWANEFSKELGYIDFDCLENFVGFNLTGGIFNTKDFIKIGRLKPSIEIAFNYEFLLRLTNRKLKAFVVPKEGYNHLVDRTDSLTEHYIETMNDNIIKKWFEVARSEYAYTEDRKTKPVLETEKLK